MSSKVYSSEELSLITQNINRLSYPSYDYFVENFMKVNLPCIFTSDITDSWKSRKKWVTKDGKPDLDYLINNFGSSIVPVVLCDNSKSNCYDRKEMPLKSYIEQNMTPKNNNIPNEKYFYLKDWHFNRAFPNYEAYVTPEYFQEDWLNEFCEEETDDFKFVYIGPQGTWTSLHADVYGSYSWSANICGRKRWLLFPPGQEKSLINSNSPPLMINELSNIKCNFYLDIVQEPGEIIFVPSGWYHQVWNLEDTISINHNWFNGYNIDYIWNCLNIANYEVEQEISDLKESDDWWNDHQFLLKAHHGMDLNEFFRILEFIFKKRTNSFLSSENFKNGNFDIISLHNVCEKMLSATLPKNLLQNIMNFCEIIKNFDMRE